MIASIKGRLATMHIFKLLAMVNPGDHPQPVPFGGVGKPVNQNGFTDHFPITITVTELN